MRAVWQFVLIQYRQDPLYFWLGIFVAILPAAAGILLLGVSGWFITAAAVAGLSGAFLNIFAPSAIIRALAIIRTAGRYGERVLTHDATFRFLTGLRNRLFTSYAHRNVGGHRSALLLNRLTLDISTLDSVYLRLVVPFAVAVVICVGLIVVWVNISGLVFLTGLFFLTAWAGLAWGAIFRSDGKVARRADAASDAMRLRAADLAAGRRDLAVYGGLEDAANSVLNADEKLQEAEDAQERRIIRLTGMSLLIGQFFLAAALLVFVWSAANGVIGTPLAVGMVLVVMALPEIMGLALPGLARLPGTALAARRAILPGPATEATRNLDTISLGIPELESSATTVLRFEDVTFGYPGAIRNVLETVSFEIESDEVVAIAGRSGCGKSTVAALASRLRVPDHGRIFLNGKDLSQLSEELLRHSVTVIGQRPYLFNDTVAANLRIANPAASESDLWAALEKAALAERISRNADGLQSVLGENGLGLSGGESRRLALARAFLTRPGLFILDEMTEGLDQRTASDVLSRFLEFKGQAAVLMIAHKRLELEAADRVLHLPRASGPGVSGN